jgi:hypothetical protein
VRTTLALTLSLTPAEVHRGHEQHERQGDADHEGAVLTVQTEAVAANALAAATPRDSGAHDGGHEEGEEVDADALCV